MGQEFTLSTTTKLFVSKLRSNTEIKGVHTNETFVSSQLGSKP
jgi:hypothetical protein